jgi:hypothetical protein
MVVGLAQYLGLISMVPLLVGSSRRGVETPSRSAVQGRIVERRVKRFMATKKKAAKKKKKH